MMKVNRLITAAALIIMLFACASPKEKWFNSLVNTAQVTDKNLHLSIAKLPLEQDTSTLNYRVRLTPADDLQAAITTATKEVLLYKMDSCFYVAAGTRSIYPVACQNVNSGLKNTFEYMLTFEIGTEVTANNMQLIYRDKLFGKKTYNLKLYKD